MQPRRCIPFFGASLSCWLGCRPGLAFRGLQTRLQSSGWSGSGAAVEDLLTAGANALLAIKYFISDNRWTGFVNNRRACRGAAA